MDSGNSTGSMQSSSGGDEEYDSSRPPGDSSNFFNPSSHLGNSISYPPTFSYSHHSSQNSLHPISHSQSSPSLYNQDFWSNNITSSIDQPNYPTPQSSSSQSLLASQGQGQGRPFPSSSTQQPDHQANVVAKNPKKRTRASRRAPTTVLTTDTTNFRQMVQEFTGIPAAPFAAASPYSRRLDLFAAGSLYPLRPSAQKAAEVNMSSAPNSLLNSSNIMLDSLANITSNVPSTSNTNNYPQSHQNMLNMQQNPILTFQSLLQSHHQDPSSSTFGATKSSQENSRIPPSLDDLGMSNQHVTNNANLSGLFPSQQSVNGTQGRGDNTNLSRWRDGGASSNVDGEHFGSFNQQNVQPAEKAGVDQNVSSRGEGTVGSWNPLIN